MAESILTKIGDGKFQAFSAGSHPTGRVNALTIDELRWRGYPTEGLASKSWLEFASANSVELDFVISVCANATAEHQPKWPGNPRKLEWDFPPPGQVTGTDEEIRAAFTQVCGEIENAIKEFVDSQADQDRAAP
jgi:arsenate reductase (thioredoxin)